MVEVVHASVENWFSVLSWVLRDSTNIYLNKMTLL